MHESTNVKRFGLVKAPYFIAPCLVVCVGLYSAMQATAPQYDDTLNQLLLQNHGPDSLYTGHFDRPIYGWIQRELAARGVLYPVCLAATALGWFGFGITAVSVARRLFPDCPTTAVTASLLTVSPMLVETQFVALNIITWGQALAHLAYAIHLRPLLGKTTWIAVTVLSFVLVVVSTAVLEYGLAASCAGIALLTLTTGRSSELCVRTIRLRERLTAIVLAAGAIVGYVLHATIKDPTFRPGAGAAGFFSDGFFRFVKLPFRLLTALYQSSFGGLFRELADLKISDYETIAASAAGCGLAVISLLCVRRLHDERRSDVFSPILPSVVVAIVAMTAGLMPFLVMGRVPDDVSFSSRFFMPILPVAACLTSALLLRSKSLRPAMFALLAFTCGFALVSKTFLYRSEVRELATWGRQVRPLLAADGTTIAVVPCGPPPRLHRFADDELTANLTRDWSPDERRRFWAVPTLESLRPSPSSAMRGAKTEGPLRRVLLVVPRSVGDQIDIVRFDPSAAETRTTAPPP